jgi:hypothetical protein
LLLLPLLLVLTALRMSQLVPSTFLPLLSLKISRNKLEISLSNLKSIKDETMGEELPLEEFSAALGSGHFDRYSTGLMSRAIDG